MTKKKDEEDIPYVFWNKWLDSDNEERIKMLGSTMLVKEYVEYLTLKFAKAKLKKSYINYIAARQFNDYLEDFESVLLTKKKTFK